MEMEPVAAFPLWLLAVGGIVGLIVLGGAFAVIYWLMGRGKDDASAP